MRVLVACEFSGRVRDAFIERGHEAMSCDLLASETPGPHYRGDVIDLLRIKHFDLMIAHPPCTNLSAAGGRWFKYKRAAQEVDLEFVNKLLNAKIPRIALENPVGLISTRIRKPDQVICPSQFGHAYSKRTCLWLKNLPPLEPTDIYPFQPMSYSQIIDPGPNRSKFRSLTFRGIAKAMAEQWG